MAAGTTTDTLEITAVVATATLGPMATTRQVDLDEDQRNLDENQKNKSLTF
jgi:hypothetical protein